MNLFLVAIIIVLAVFVFLKFIFDLNLTNQDDNDKISDDKIPYRRKYLLTKNELHFYKGLRAIAEKRNYTILTKIRMADLVEVSSECKDSKERTKYFSKIKSKHIDFALCNKENLYPEILIELNDNSHNDAKRIQRDEFIKKVMKKSGYELLFVYSIDDLQKKLSERDNLPEGLNTPISERVHAENAKQ